MPDGPGDSTRRLAQSSSALGAPCSLVRTAVHWQSPFVRARSTGVTIGALIRFRSSLVVMHTAAFR